MKFQFCKTPGSQIVTGIVLVPLMSIAFYMVIIFFSLIPDTNLANYHTTIRPWRTEYAAYFPVMLPDDAKNIRFHHQPSFMQLPELIRLRYTLPPKQIQELIETSNRRALGKWHAACRKHSTEWSVDNAVNYVFSDSLMPVKSPTDSSDYEVFVFKTNLTQDWNHTKTSGLAISRKYNDVVYWLDSY